MTDVAVSAIVVNHSRADLLGGCLASLRHALSAIDGTGELIVVDNGSRDASVELVRGAHPEATLIPLDENRGFAAAVGEGMRRSRGRWILLLNNDATIDPRAVAELLAVGESGGDVGSVAAQMRFPGEPPVLNSAGIEVDRLGIAYDRLLGAPPEAGGSEPTEVFGASGGAALYRRAMLEEIGGFDPTFFVFIEDADVAWRARMRGWRSLYAPRAVVLHHHSATARHGSSFKHFHVGLNRVRLLAKNADRRHLRRYGPAMVAYDAAYVAYACVADRTFAPLRGRIRGLREWRSYRAGPGERRPVALAPVSGVRSALRRRFTFAGRKSTP